METFEIKREDNGISLGKFRARPQGKLVSEVLINMTKKGHDGVLLDDTTELTDTDLLAPGHIYKFRQSIHIDAPSPAGLSFCELPQQVKEVADEYARSRVKKPKLLDGIDDRKLQVHHHQASESYTSYMSEPSVSNSLQKKLQSASRRVDLILPTMVAQCKVLVEEYFSKGILEFRLQELKERYKMRFGFKLDQKVVGFESIDEFLQHAMPGRGFRSLFKGAQQFVTCDTKCLDQNFLRTLQHPIYSNQDHSASKITMEEVRAWLENLVSSGRASVGIDMSHIHHDFEKFTSKPLNYKSLHRGSLMMLILEFGDLVRIERCAFRVMVFPQHGASMYKKPQMRVVNNNTLTTLQQVEQTIKPVGIDYIRPRKNPHVQVKRINPGVLPVPPDNFPVPYKLQVPVEDPRCSTIAMAKPRSSILEELVQPVEVVANCRSSNSSKLNAHLKAQEINCSEKAASLPGNSMADPIICSMAMPRSLILEELVQPVKKVAINCRISPDSRTVGAHLKSHENCCNLTGSLNVTQCRSKEVVPIYIPKPPHPPSSPMPNTLRVRAVATTDTSKVLREREEIKNTLQSLSHILTALDKDTARIQRQNIATNTAIKKKMALSGLTFGAFLEESGGQDFNSCTLGG